MYDKSTDFAYKNNSQKTREKTANIKVSIQRYKSNLFFYHSCEREKITRQMENERESFVFFLNFIVKLKRILPFLVKIYTPEYNST